MQKSFKIILCLTAFLLSAMVLKAQVPDSIYRNLADSLKPKSKDHLTSEERMNLILYSASFATPGNNTPDYVEMLVQQALKENQTSKDKETAIKNYYAISYFYLYVMVDFEKANKYAFLCKNLCGDDARYEYYKYMVYLFLTHISIKQGKLDSGLYYIAPYIAYQKKMNDTALLSGGYSFLAKIYENIGLFEKSIAAEKDGIALIMPQDKWSYNYSSRLFNLSLHYLRYGHYTDNAKFLDTAYSIADSMSEALKEKKEYWYSALYLEKGMISFYRKDYIQAIQYLDSSLNEKLLKSSVYIRDKNMNLAFKAFSFYQMGSLRQAQAILDTIDLNKNIYTQTAFYEISFKKNLEKKNWERALKYYLLYQRNSDSINAIFVRGQMFESEQKYASAEKQAAIKTLSNKNLETQRLSSRHFIIGIIAAFMLIILLLALYVYFKKLQVKTAKDKLALLDSLHHVEATIATQRISYEAEAESSLKTEKKAISENMHDEISSGIAGLRYYITNLKMESISDEAKETLATLEQEAESLYLNARGFMNNLYREAEIPENNVADLLRQFSKIFSRSGRLSVTCAYNEKDINKLPALQNNELYLIIKELVINAVKHSGGNMVKISVMLQKHYCTFSVTDNGRGFGAANMIEGMGLKNIEKRAEAFGGSFKIISSQSGTTAEGLFPLLNANEGAI